MSHGAAVPSGHIDVVVDRSSVGWLAMSPRS